MKPHDTVRELRDEFGDWYIEKQVDEQTPSREIADWWLERTIPLTVVREIAEGMKKPSPHNYDGKDYPCSCPMCDDWRAGNKTLDDLLTQLEKQK